MTSPGFVEPRGQGAQATAEPGGPLTPLRVLLIEDNPADAELLRYELRRNGFEPIGDRVDTEPEYLERLGPDIDVILADYHLPQFDAARALRLLQERSLDIPFIIVSGSIGEETAVSIMKEGAADYLIKDRLGRLGEAVRHALDQRQLSRVNRHAQAALRRSEERYRDLFENANDVIYTHDLEGNFTSANKAAERVSGYRREEILHMNVADLLPPEQHELGRQMTATVLQATRASHQLDWVTRDGVRVPLEVNVRLIYEGDGPVGVQGIARDISERKKAEEEIAFLVYHDRLTGLPGRTMFEELLEMAMARAERHRLAVAVLHVDLDNLKLVNDSLGHAAGDVLLQEVASRLRETARETDMVARLGGDEFLMLLADLQPDAGQGQTGAPSGGAPLVATSVASRVHAALRSPFRVGGTEAYVTASVGISMFPQDALNGAILLKHAHAAMHQSKRKGPGGYVLFSEEAVHPLTELPFATKLRKAVEREQWVLRYQPIVELFSGQMVGVEGLVRWRRPGGKLVMPIDFIPLAEEMGLIEAIGDWVLKEASRQCREWRDEGVGLDIGFNLSPLQLWQPDLVDRVLTHFERHRLDPSLFVAEITESTVTIDLDRTKWILWELHQSGLRIAIDDFGTGSSSLSRLKDLPVDILKIDRSFVQELPRDEDAGKLVTAVIQLAHGLGMVPLAEGIETAEQWRYLAESGCSLGQGYHFCRPVTAREIRSRYMRERGSGSEEAAQVASSG